MVVRDREADSSVEVWMRSEPSVFCENIDSWGALWVVGWACDFADVVSTLVMDWLVYSEYDIEPNVRILRIWQANKVVRDPPMLFDLSVIVFPSGLGLPLESHLALCFALHFLS